MSMSVDEAGETSMEHCDTCASEERELSSQPSANVSQDMRLTVTTPKPQACPALSPLKFLTGVISSEEYSQAPSSSGQVACSPQPSPEHLTSLGIKVRDFAYENTLPAIVPVPRVPRQVQPAPRMLKRPQRGWVDEEGDLQSVQPLSGHVPPPEKAKSRSLERKATEPLEETAFSYTRTLGRIAVKRVCSIITSPPRRTPSPATPRRRISASPPRSTFTPSLSQLASQESELIQTPSAFPFVLCVDDASMIPASQLDSESQPLSIHPVLYTKVELDAQASPPDSSPGCSPRRSASRNASPPQLMGPFLELPSPIKEMGKDRRGRESRGCGIAGTTPSASRYELRQRPIRSCRTSSVARYLHQPSNTPTSLSRRTRHKP